MSKIRDAKLTAEFITPDDARWTTFLDRTKHDFYHLPDYVRLEAEQSGRTAMAFYAEFGDARFLIPLLVSSLPPHLSAPDDWCDAVTPYGYPCPLLEPAGDEECLRIFLEAFREAAAGQGIVSAFLRLHTLLPLPQKPLQEFGDLVRHGQTVYFNLRTPEEEATANLSTNHRRDIKKLIATGYKVQVNDWSHYPRFVEIYRATMRRLNATEMYFFEGDYFPRLREILGERIFLSTVLSPQGEVAAGGLFIQTCGIVQYHLAGTADEFQRRSPIKLMVHEMRRWAKEDGCDFLHMGGGLGGSEDSLFRFKAGFSDERADFFTSRIIPDAAKYQAAVQLWQRAGGQAQEQDGFFPLYRRPLA